MSATLHEVLITAELARRPTRSPDYEAENQALSKVAEAIAGPPQMIFQKVVETALTLCRADSAVISILESVDVRHAFRWRAIAGQFAANTGRRVQREGSPSAIVLDRDASLLFSYPGRHFDYGPAIDPPIVEALLVPFHAEGKPVGTLWVMAHTPLRKFDTKDQRVLTTLSRFASAAYQIERAALTDVAELKRTTEALRESEERLRLALSSGTVGIWDWDVTNGVLAWSPELCEIYGVDARAALTYRDFTSRVHPDDLVAVESDRDAAIRNHKQFDLEFRIVLPSGEIRWVSVRGKGYYDENGRVVRVVGDTIDITERVRAKEALQEREQRLRLALDASGAGSWMRDIRTGQTDWDDRFRRLYGVTAEERASFETFLSRVHEEDRQQVLEFLDQIRNTKAHDSFDITFRIVRPDGSVSWIQSLGQVHRDADGQVTRLTGIELDITKHHHAEEALREKEGREAFLLRLEYTLRPLSDPLAMQEATARLLCEHLRVSRVTYCDIEGTDYIVRLSHVNGVAPLVGRGPVTDFGKWLLESHKSGEPIVVNDFRTDPRYTAGERARYSAMEMAAFAGVMIVKDEKWVAAFGVDNATPRAWTRTEVELIRDVAERVWEAVERARAEAALRERQQLLSLALDASAAGVWTWDRFTNQSIWDDRFDAQYDFAPEGPRNFHTWLSRVHEEDRPRVLGDLDDILRGHHNEWSVIFRVVRSDGTVSWMHGLGRADRGPDGQVTRISGINLDITERRRAEEALQARRDEERDRELHKQAEEALRRSHAELEQRAVQLRRLASQLTLTEQNAREHLARTLHDGLQQLLFSAWITLDQAVRAQSHDDQVGLLQRARAEVKEGMEAARTLSINLFPPLLHVGGLPAALKWLAQRTQEQYDVAVNVTADPHANPTASDVRILLFEAVRELLFNAVKHAHVDRIDVNLEVGPDDTIHIHVRDEGVGFDPASVLQHGQVGLGLFSIKERLALFGGRLDIQSTPGKGSLFSLTLPGRELQQLATDAGSQDAGWRERLVYDSADGQSKPVRILIADDHVVARAGLRELLSGRPTLQIVGEAANGVEAISQALALQPDVVVMDVSMPQMNGIAATREIHGAMPQIQIVGLSTYDDENSERSMRDAGAEAYFTKNEGADRLLNYLLSLRTQAKGTAKS